MKAFLIAIFFMISISCFAQKTHKLTFDEIKDHIENAFDPLRGTNVINHFCGRGSIFIRIKLNSDNNSLNITLTKDSSQLIVKSVTVALSFLQKDKDLIYFLKNTRKTIIVPLIYNFEASCDLSLKASREEADKAWMNYEMAMSNLYSTILDMLNFNDGKLNYIDCILLSPCII